MTGRLEPPAPFDGEPAAHYQDRRTAWLDAVHRLKRDGEVFHADLNLLAVYAQAVASHAQASQLLAKSNVLIIRDGKAVENPALAVQRRTAADVAAASKALGLHRSPVVTALAESPMVELRRRCAEHGGRWECSKHRSDGEPCHSRSVIPGTGACYKHVGMSREKAREKGRVALARLYQSRLDVSPGEALLEEVRWAAGAVADLRVRVAELGEVPGPDGEPGSGLWWGVSRETTKDGVTEREYRAGPHVILQAYDQQRAHLVRAAAAAHAAGAQEAAVDAARAVGAGLGRLLDAVFDVLDLDERQRALIPVRVPALLREFDPGGEAAGT